MHTNYHFLTKIVDHLRPRWVGLRLLAAFSQNKDELVLGFGSASDELWLRAQLGNGADGHGGGYHVSFPTQFARAKRNSVDLFDALLDAQVVDIVVTPFDRSFSIILQEPRHKTTYTLFIRLHGPRSNAVAFRHQKDEHGTHLVGLMSFHTKREAELLLTPDQLALTPDLGREAWQTLQDQPNKWLPTLGPLPIAWLNEQGYLEASESHRWTLIQTLLAAFDEGSYYHITHGGKPHLSLVSLGEVAATYQDPVAALNDYVNNFLHLHGLSIAKEAAKAKVKQRIKQTEKYLSRITDRLQQLRTERSPEEVGHLLMANAHLITPHQTELVVADWYHPDEAGQPTEYVITLKPEVPPHKQAELLYRKAGNRKLELTHLSTQLEVKENLSLELMTWVDEIDALVTRKALKSWLQQHQLERPEAQTGDAEESLPYKRFVHAGYEIRVGKNAAANDILTLKHAYKDDLWLHARGFAGSHVVIKVQAGKPVPQAVIDHAAGLAVWYSKGKTQPLCPVILTPKKFVRKAKGSAPGSVIVERETVVLANAIKPE
jgi:predicted ribosome quality control (RQC) complex YloA/Tae2 family protein